MDARHLVLSLSVSLWILTGCGLPHAAGDRGPCADGGSRCAAAAAPAGLRAVRRGHRITRARWLQRANRESGQPDIGLQAEWAPITERR